MALVLASTLLLAACGEPPTAPGSRTAASSAGRAVPGSGHDAPAAPRRRGLVVPRPRPLPASTGRWAVVERPVTAWSAPGGEGRLVGRMWRQTPEGTANVVALTGRRGVVVRGRLWVQARLAGSAVGWVPRRALGAYHEADAELTVDRARFVARLRRAGRTVFRARIGIGTPDAPTPAGRFYVRSRLAGFGDPAYGPVAFGTSARSALTDWPAGGFVGIHGTDQPQLLPGRVSHGCIRLADRDAVRLARLLPVGTPVVIR